MQYDVRAKPRNVASLTGTKDLQMVNITVRVLSKPNASKLATIYKTLGIYGFPRRNTTFQKVPTMMSASYLPL